MSAELRKEFLVERQGKMFVLYAGLLDLAHQRGLKRIRTEIVQLPTEENKHTAVVTAVALTEDNKDFSGIGDASPRNVAPAMQTCLLRMAETRAKARALRDMTNIGVAALEELAEEEAAQEQAQAARPIQERAKPAEEVDTEQARIKQARDTFFNRCGQLGHTFTNDEAGKQEYRHFVSVLLGHSVASLKELTWQDWGTVLRNLNNAQKEAKTA